MKEGKRNDGFHIPANQVASEKADNMMYIFLNRHSNGFLTLTNKVEWEKVTNMGEPF